MLRLKQAPWEYQEIQEGFLQEVMDVPRLREWPEEGSSWLRGVWFREVWGQRSIEVRTKKVG